MSQQMDIIDVFRVLLDGGCVCKKVKVQGAAEYKVMLAGKIKGMRGDVVGHISEKRFETLMEKDVLKSTYETIPNKYGNVSYFYMLPHYAMPIQRNILESCSLPTSCPDCGSEAEVDSELIDNMWDDEVQYRYFAFCPKCREVIASE